MKILMSICDLKETNFEGVQGTAIQSNYSNLNISILYVDGVGKNAISAASGNVEAKNVVIKNVLNKALNFTDNVKVYMFKTDLYDCYQSFYANDQADVKMVRFWNQDIEKGIELRSGAEPHAKVVFDEFNYKNVEQLYLIKQGLSLMINGKKEKG